MIVMISILIIADILAVVALYQAKNMERGETKNASGLSQQRGGRILGSPFGYPKYVQQK